MSALPIRRVRMSPHENIMWVVLKHRREGRLCYMKNVNCGCDKDKIFERLAIKTDSRHYVFCFAERLPCCAYIVTDVFGVEELIQVGSITFRIIPPGEDTARNIENLYRCASGSTEV